MRFHSVLVLIALLVLSASPAFAEEALLRYRFTEGEVLRYEFVNVIDMRSAGENLRQEERGIIVMTTEKVEGEVAEVAQRIERYEVTLSSPIKGVLNMVFTPNSAQAYLNGVRIPMTLDEEQAAIERVRSAQIRIRMNSRGIVSNVSMSNIFTPDDREEMLKGIFTCMEYPERPLSTGDTIIVARPLPVAWLPSNCSRNDVDSTIPLNVVVDEIRGGNCRLSARMDRVFDNVPIPGLRSGTGTFTMSLRTTVTHNVQYCRLENQAVRATVQLNSAGHQEGTVNVTITMNRIDDGRQSADR